MILFNNAFVSLLVSSEVLRILVRVVMYFMAMRSVVIFVNFSLLLTGLLSPNETGTHCRRCSNALFISRIRMRSRALAVFRRYLLNGAAFCLDFDFSAPFLLVFVCGVDDSGDVDEVVAGSTALGTLDLVFVLSSVCLLVFRVGRFCRCRNEYFSFG